MLKITNKQARGGENEQEDEYIVREANSGGNDYEPIIFV